MVTRTMRVTRHLDLFDLLQGDAQYFIPHQIFISGWGDFGRPGLGFDVISALPGIRTGESAGCGIESLLSGLHSRWVARGRAPLLLPCADVKAIWPCSRRSCALHAALGIMQEVLVHGVRDLRDEIDSLYLALNAGSIARDHGAERFSALANLIIAQIDAAFRRVSGLQGLEATASDRAPKNPVLLSLREQQIVNWIASGKTNSEISKILFISASTVKHHVQRIFRKLGASNRTEVAARYFEAGGQLDGNGRQGAALRPLASRPATPVR